MATVPLRASTVDPTGTDARPLSGTKPGEDCFKDPLGNFTNTSPATTSMLTRSPAIGASVPGAPTSQASPTRSASPSAWPAFGTAVQLSPVSGTPSPSASGAVGTGCGNGGPATAHVYTAGVSS